MIAPRMTWGVIELLYLKLAPRTRSSADSPQSPDEPVGASRTYGKLDH